RLAPPPAARRAPARRGANGARASLLRGSKLRAGPAPPGSRPSSEPTGHVVLAALVARLREDLRPLVVLDEDASAVAVGPDLHREERGHVGDARGLLHVVRDDHDRVVA